MTEIAALVIGVALMRLAAPREALLRAAIVAQAADLATFAIAWHDGQGERNPISRLALDLSFALFSPADWIVVAAAGLGLIALKVALVAFVISIAPHLGRYRQAVLIVAAAAGTIGAVSNVVAYPNAIVAPPALALFLVVAIRWPSRFGDAVGASIRLVAAACLALAGIAAVAYVPLASVPYLCGAEVCWPGLGAVVLAIAAVSFVAAAVVLVVTLRFAARVLRAQAGEPT